jgi:hypothetical protein
MTYGVFGLWSTDKIAMRAHILQAGWGNWLYMTIKGGTIHHYYVVHVATWMAMGETKEGGLQHRQQQKGKGFFCLVSRKTFRLDLSSGGT